MAVSDFFSQYAPYAQSVSRSTGIDPRIVLAQAALETGYGRSAPNYNLFGIKGKGSTQQTKEFVDGKMVSMPQEFRAYGSPEESFQDYAKLMSGKRYEGVRSGGTLEEQIAALQKSGYATDPKYGQKVMQIAKGIKLEGLPMNGPTQQKQPQGLLGGLLGGQGIGGALGLSDDLRDRLAMGIMAGSDPRQFAPLIEQRAASMKERKAEAKEQRQRNKSLEYLKQRADAGDAMAGQIYGAVSTGVLPVGAGVSEYLTQSLKGNGVTDTTDYKNYSEYVKGMENPISFKEYMDAKDLQPIQNKGTYRYDNRIIGEVMFDPNKGEFFETVNGQRVPIDISKAQPVTDATFAKAIPNYGDFVKLSEGLSEDRTSMDRLQSYMKSIGNTNEGFQRLGDQMTASLKTLLSGIAGPEWTTLSKEELNAAVAQGQLQGLIGRFRIETVGGGVMTEQDALRIIANLGGDVNALQNKEIVAQQIETLFRGKLKSFDSKRKRHDAAIDALYGGMGFDKVDEYEFDEDVFNLKGSVSDTKATMTDDQLLSGAQGKTGAALSQYLQSLSEADFNRLMQLQ